MKTFICFFVFLAATWTASAGSIFYSIGDNGAGQPVSVVGIDPVAGTATPLFDLQSATAAFSGLTYNTSNGQFYAVMNDTDSSGNATSTLVNFSLAGGGAYNTVMPLDTGSLAAMSFNGGLVYDPFDSYFYGMANTSDDYSFLYRIDTSGAGSLTLLTERLPQWFGGGLTMNSDGTLLGMLNDSDGNSFVYQFDLNSPSMPQQLYSGSVGTGFSGGLAWAGMDLYGIDTDFNGGSSLTLINSSDPFPVGNGFYNAGLTLGAAGDDSTPEPATWSLLAGGLALAAAASLRRMAGSTAKVK